MSILLYIHICIHLLKCILKKMYNSEFLFTNYNLFKISIKKKSIESIFFFFFFYPTTRNTTEVWDRIENMYSYPNKGGICVEGVYKSILSNSRNRVIPGIYDLHEWLRKLFRAESYNEGCFDRQTVLARWI